MSDKYRIDPDFEPPAPSAAKYHSYWPLEEHNWARMQEGIGSMAKAGAQSYRVTLVTDENSQRECAQGGPHD